MTIVMTLELREALEPLTDGRWISSSRLTLALDPGPRRRRVGRYVVNQCGDFCVPSTT
ncbi:MAG: hypothetical protein M3Y49_05170 [Actinomycetota bacterium]|nr:hypothetical protein [Actinomycetota bacterium]